MSLFRYRIHPLIHLSYMSNGILVRAATVYLLGIASNVLEKVGEEEVTVGSKVSMQVEI